MKKICLISALLIACLAWSPASADDGVGAQLVKLFPATPDGWKGRFKPAWRKSGAGGRAFWSWRKSPGKGKVMILYRWKPNVLDTVKTMMANPDRAAKVGWKPATLGGRKWLVQEKRNRVFMQTVVGDDMVVFVQTFDATRADVEMFAKLVPFDKLAGVK